MCRFSPWNFLLHPRRPRAADAGLTTALFLLSLSVHGDVLGYGLISGVGRNVCSGILKLDCEANRVQVHFNTKATVYRCDVKLRFVSRGMHHALSMGKADPEIHNSMSITPPNL